MAHPLLMSDIQKVIDEKNKKDGDDKGTTNKDGAGVSNSSDSRSTGISTGSQPAGVPLNPQTKKQPMRTSRELAQSPLTAREPIQAGVMSPARRAVPQTTKTAGASPARNIPVSPGRFTAPSGQDVSGYRVQGERLFGTSGDGQQSLAPFLETVNRGQSIDAARGHLQIGQYILGETLGVGTFGKVKIAEHTLTKHKVAVKILNRKKIKSLDMKSKIKREIQNLKLFRHPHVIKLYEVITTPTDIFMIMEYVSGGELFDYIVKHGRLSENEARRFFQQIISGIDYCHRHMVVHRDLKPENLLLDSAMNIKIADFGLSCMMTDGDFLQTSCGSPNYAAPEVISGQLYVGPEVDVWSCGVILFALLCGRLPFDDEYIPNLFKKIKAGKFTIPDHVSEGAARILVRTLNVNPLKRATIAEIIESPWFLEKLPLYLLPHIVQERTETFDEAALDEVQQNSNATREEIIEAVNSDDPRSALKIAYHLAMDNRSVPIDADRYVTDPDQVRKSLHVHDPMSFVTEQDLETGRVPPTWSQIRASGRKSKWHLGIRSRNRPEDVMQEVFASLKALNYVWKCVGPYQVWAKRPAKKDTEMDIKILLQLYRVDDKHFLLDFKNLTVVPRPERVRSTSQQLARSKSQDNPERRDKDLQAAETALQEAKSQMQEPKAGGEGWDLTPIVRKSTGLLQDPETPKRANQRWNTLVEEEPIWFTQEFFKICGELITELAVSR
eukprot:Clim_evm32s150 gene=Clim_evmTU32s150